MFSSRLQRNWTRAIVRACGCSEPRVPLTSCERFASSARSWRLWSSVKGSGGLRGGVLSEGFSEPKLSINLRLGRQKRAGQHQLRSPFRVLLKALCQVEDLRQLPNAVTAACSEESSLWAFAPDMMQELMLGVRSLVRTCSRLHQMAAAESS